MQQNLSYPESEYYTVRNILQNQENKEGETVSPVVWVKVRIYLQYYWFAS